SESLCSLYSSECIICTFLIVPSRGSTVGDEQNATVTATVTEEEVYFVWRQEVLSIFSCNVAAPKLGKLDLLCDIVKQGWITCNMAKHRVGGVRGNNAPVNSHVFLSL